MDPTKSLESNNNRANATSETRVQALPTAEVAEDILTMINLVPRNQQILGRDTAMYLMRLAAIAETGGVTVTVRGAARVVGSRSIAPAHTSVLSLTPMTTMARVNRRSVEILEELVGQSLETYNLPYRVAHDMAVTEERLARQARRNQAAMERARRHAADLDEEMDVPGVPPVQVVRNAVARGADRDAAAVPAPPRGGANPAAAAVPRPPRGGAGRGGGRGGAGRGGGGCGAAGRGGGRTGAHQRRGREGEEDVQEPPLQRPRVVAGGGGGVDDESPARAGAIHPNGAPDQQLAPQQLDMEGAADEEGGAEEVNL